MNLRLAAAITVLASSPVLAATSVTRTGVTFTFAVDATCGTFVTGDPWCVAPVTLTAITPAAASGANGFMVNPVDGRQSFDSRAGGYDGQLMPALPYVATAGQSIAKAVSHAGACSAFGPTCIDDVVVLTVLAQAPSATAFRPSYFGATKTLFDAANLRMQLLPSLASVTGTPSIATVEGYVTGVCADHYDCCSGTRNAKPNNACPNYGADQGRELNDAVLRTFLDDPISSKRDLVHKVVQRGIDLFGMHQGGRRWTESGGQSYGRKLAIAYAGWLLDDAPMKAAAGYPGSEAAAYFSEDFMTYFAPNADPAATFGGAAGEVLFGKEKSECQYWGCPAGHGCPASCTTGYNSDDRDPYGLIDASAYIKNAASYKGLALAQLLVPELRDICDYDPLITFTERYSALGLWRAPDTCALTPPATFNGSCTAGGPRFPGEHGSMRDDWGSASSAFQDAMWSSYLTCSKGCACPGQSCDGGVLPADAGTPDAGAADGGGAVTDGGSTAPDAGGGAVDAGADQPIADPADASGCTGCGAAGLGVPLSLLTLAAAMRRRRR